MIRSARNPLAKNRLVKNPPPVATIRSVANRVAKNLPLGAMTRLVANRPPKNPPLKNQHPPTMIRSAKRLRKKRRPQKKLLPPKNRCPQTTIRSAKHQQRKNPRWKNRLAKIRSARSRRWWSCTRCREAGRC